jgi:type IV pilus assembly protein PilM
VFAFGEETGMAKKTLSVWAIDVGQAALKALRCRLDGDVVVAESYDFIEYPKILSQPEAEPEKLVADALQQFLSRNDVRQCKIGISVPGQNGLAKFFKPPPVEVKKIPDIVRYEAKQQIPFDLNDVIWDFQQMAGSNVEDGYALESEVGLFAMKREAVFRALKPFRDASIDVDVIQLAPLSIYNMLAYDMFAERLQNETFDVEHPPKSIVLLSLGTDATDLLVTNGFRVWQRNMPIGGNHFTRQLTKDLKLTFAKAEHLKRNAMQADDPKLVFQAMRPIFNDLVTETQRSIGFFKGLNKKAEIESIVLLGNTVKLPGLQPYLNKNLGYEVNSLEKFDRLTGSEVLGAPAFKENQLAFGVVYGLCLQMLNQGPISTNLVPREIVMERVVRAKKPWVVAAVSILIAGMIVNYAFMSSSVANVDKSKWEAAENVVTQANSTSTTLKSQDDTLKSKVELLKRIGLEVSSNADRRVLWLELLTAIYHGMNRDPKLEKDPNISPTEYKFEERKDFHFKKVESQFQDDLSKWYTKPLKEQYALQKLEREQLLGLVPNKVGPDGKPLPATPAPEDKLAGPGWVIELDGYHFYNGKRGEEKINHLRRYLINYFENGSVDLPDTDGDLVNFKLKELGISHPIVVSFDFKAGEKIPNPVYLKIAGTQSASAPGASGRPGLGGGSRPGLGGGGAPGGGVGDESSSASDTGGGTGGESTGTTGGSGRAEIRDAEGKLVPKNFSVDVFYFKLQFVWQETPLSVRLQEKKKAEEAARKKDGSLQANTQKDGSVAMKGR